MRGNFSPADGMAKFGAGTSSSRDFSTASRIYGGTMLWLPLDGGGTFPCSLPSLSVLSTTAGRRYGCPYKQDTTTHTKIAVNKYTIYFLPNPLRPGLSL